MILSLPRIFGRFLSRLTPRPSSKRRARWTVLQLEGLETRLNPSTLIPVTNHRDLVFDPTRDLLYITTSAGTVQQYSVLGQSLLSPLNVGTSLNGADITPDGSALYVAENQAGPTQGVIHKVNLTTDAVTDLPYTLGFYEGGSWDVALDANGIGLATTSFNGSGWVPLRQDSLATDTLSLRTDDPGSGGGGKVFGKSLIYASADRSTFLITESGISSGPLFLYNANTNTFSSSFNTNAYLDHLAAINRNGALIAVEKYGTGLVVMDHNFNTVATLSSITGGVVFDPIQDILYGVNTSTSQIVAYDTNTWAVKFQMAIGETVSTGATFGNGVMTVSNDGSLLFLATASGVRMFNLPAPPTVSQFVVSGIPSPSTAGTPGSFTVTAASATGSPVPGYTGTVHFTSSDAEAWLPADYTFTAADQGVHTFTATLKTAGTQSITVTDTAHGTLTGKQTGITVNAGVANQLITSGPAASQAGASFSVTVRAVDANGNLASGYTGTVHFSSSDVQAGLPANYTFTATDAGVHTFTVTLRTVGSESLTIADTGTSGLSSTLGSIAVSPAAATRLSVTGFPSPITAGVSGSFTVTALDPYGNTASGYTGTVRFSTGAQGTLPGNYSFTSGDQGTHTFGATLVTAGSWILLVTDVSNSSLSGSETGIQVTAGAIAGLRIYSTSSNSYPAYTGRPTDVTVAGVDAYGNPSPGYTGTVHFTSTDGSALLPADYTFTAADQGLHTFANGVTLETTGSQTITATDSGNSAFAGFMTLSVVNPLAGFRLALSTSVTTTPAGTPLSFTVTALDGNNNVIPGYNGTVTLSCPTGYALLPASYTFTTADQGVHTFTSGATLYTAGNQSLVAVDPVNAPGGGAVATVLVTPLAACGLVLGGFPAVTTAGSAGTFTVVAVDYYGNVATGYSGTVHFSSSDSQAVLPADTILNGGIGTFNATLKTAGSQSLTVSDGANGFTSTQLGILVNAGAASGLVLSGLPAPGTAGVARTFTVTAMDAYGNTASDYTGTVHFSSSDNQAVLPADTILNGGIGTFNATLKTAGSQSLTVSDGANGLTSTQRGILVNAGAASGFALSGLPASGTAGVAETFTVIAQDAYGNTASGYAGTVHFSSSDRQAVLPADTILNGGIGTFNATLKTAGSQSLTVSDGANGFTSTQLGILVNAGAASGLVLSGLPAPGTAGVARTFTVTAQDTYGNTASGYAGTVHFSSSDAQAALPANYTFAPSDNGSHSFSVTLKTAGSQSLTVADTAAPTVTATQSGLLVGPAAPTSLLLTGLPAAAIAGVPFSVTVAALDPYGNSAIAYSGTVAFSSSDALAGLPASYNFTPNDVGSHSFSVTFKTAGSQTLRVQDTQGGVVAAQGSILVNAAAASTLRLTGFPATVTAGAAGSFTVTARDVYGNVASGYTGTIHFSTSDSQGALPVNYSFTATDGGVHTFSATLKTAGSQSLTAVDIANSGLTATQASIQVSAAAPSWLNLTGLPAATTAGLPVGFTLTAMDGYGNVAVGYAGTVVFSSTDGQAGLPASYTFTAGDHGVHSFSATLKTAGSQHLVVKDSQGTVFATQMPIQVNAAGGSALIVGNLPGQVTAGTTGSLTVVAVDPYGNIATGYTGTVTFSSSDLQASLPASYTFGAGDQGIHTFNVTLKTAGLQSVTVTDAAHGWSKTQAGILVTAAAASKFMVAGFASSTTAGVAQTFTVTVKDAYGNTVTGYAGTVAFSSSDGQAALPAAYTFTAADQGQHTFTATLKTAGTQSLTVTDTSTPSVTGSQTGIAVTAAAAAHFVLSAPATAKLGVAFFVTVTAVDAYGNIVKGYRGHVHFSSSDKRANLPGDYTFSSSDNGVHTFSVILKTTGTETLTLADTAIGSINGTASILVS